MPMSRILTAEHARLAEVHDDHRGWRRWGPYVSERAWGTVREDYSADGSAWDYFPHDLARSKAYRWGEDGLAGICDRYQLLVLRPRPLEREGPDPQGAALRPRALRGQPRRGREGVLLLPRLDADPLLHEVALQVPAAEFPYRRLIEENRRRRGTSGEFELLDTGHLRRRPLLRRLRRVRQGRAGGHRACGSWRTTAGRTGAPPPAAAPLVPQHLGLGRVGDAEPIIRRGAATTPRSSSLVADDRTGAPLAGIALPLPPGGAAPLRSSRAAGCSSPTTRRTRRGSSGPGRGAGAPTSRTRSIATSSTARTRVNPDEIGTKACVHYRYVRAAGGSVALRSGSPPTSLARPWPTSTRSSRAPRRGRRVLRRHPAPGATDDERLVQRQAFAGMLWSKQIYLFDVNRWLEGDNPAFPPPASRTHGPQHPLAAPQLDADPLHARQVGVPLVRRLGPGLSRRRPRPRRPRVREGAALAAAVRAVPASHRARFRPTSGSSPT